MTQRVLAGLVLVLMLAAAGVAALLQPRIRLADELGALKLDEVIPASFGDWREDRSAPALVVNPQAQQVLEQIYSQTLSRVYLNKQGYRIMLSIAYGGDQRDAMQVHYPEVCYPAQGFAVTSNERGLADTGAGPIPVRRLETALGRQRPEPVTYWTTVGERVVRGDIDKKLAEMSYGLTGRIPDGMLFRVSSVDPDSKRAFAMQGQFIADVVAALPARYVARFNGSPAPRIAPVVRVGTGS